MSKRRLIEWGKNLVILLLTASALYLLTMTPLVQDSGLADLFAPRVEQPGGEVVLSAAAHPSRMAVMGGNGRYGLQYDQEAVDELFARMGPLLGEGLTSSGEPRSVSEQDWQSYLIRSGIYYDFDRSIPLSALGSWLDPDGVCSLEGTARRILLTAGENDRVWLCYQDGADGRFYACTTELSCSLHLEPLVNSEEGNAAQFAFENEELSRLLRPYTLVTEGGNGEIYTAVNPLDAYGEEAAVLKKLSFGSDSHAPVSGGEAYLDGSARLEVTEGGTLIYNDGQQRKYPVAAAGEHATVAEVIEAARQLAEGTMGTRCGQARLYLESVRETQDGYRVRFGYRLNGSAVWLYEEGWAAEFLIREGCISEFTMHFRAYSDSGEKALLLPMNQAAVILPGLTDEARELVIQYRDRGGETVSPGWVAE